LVRPRQVVSTGRRREGAVERQDLEPVTRQGELADDLGSQQRHHVRADRILEARVDFLGHRCAAEHVTAFEDENLAPRTGQVCGVDQAVVTAPDGDRVVVHLQFIANIANIANIAKIAKIDKTRRWGSSRQALKCVSSSRMLAMLAILAMLAMSREAPP